MKSLRFFSFFAFFLVLVSAKASNGALVDSLVKMRNTAITDSASLAINNQIIWQFLFSDAHKAQEFIRVSEELAKKPNQTFGQISLLNIKGIYFDVNGVSDSSFYYFDQALQLSREKKIRIHEEHCLNNLGMFFWNQGRNKQALEYFLASLKLNQELHGEDNIGQSGSLSNIGLIYQEMSLYAKALPYHLKAYELRKKAGKITQLIASLNNLGICYKSLDQIDSAKFYLKEGLALKEEVNHEIDYYRLLNTLADCYYLEGELNEALKLNRTSLNRPKTVPFNEMDKSKVFTDLSMIFLGLQQADSSLYYGLMAKEIIEKDSSLQLTLPETYLALSNAYLLLGKTSESAVMNGLFLSCIERKYNAESLNSMQELEVKYQTEKKEKELAEAKLDIAKQARTRNIILVVSLILLLVSLAVYNNQRLKNRQLKIESELQQAILKIENHNELQEQRLEISRNLHDNIGAQLTFIISAIDNLKIFDLNRDKLIIKYDQLSDFTRNAIVDLRDTIWAMNKANISYEDLKTRILNFIHQAKESVKITHFDFQFPELSKVNFDSKKGVEIFRIIQESVNNAIKHAEATEIKVEIIERDKQTEINIRDNGIGFKLEEVIQGNGIQSIKSRAESINAMIKWEAAEPGTRVVLTLG